MTGPLKIIIYGRSARCVIIPKRECERLGLEYGDYVDATFTKLEKVNPVPTQKPSNMKASQKKEKTKGLSTKQKPSKSPSSDSEDEYIGWTDEEKQGLAQEMKDDDLREEQKLKKFRFR